MSINLHCKRETKLGYDDPVKLDHDDKALWTGWKRLNNNPGRTSSVVGMLSTGDRLFVSLLSQEHK